jgi:hypothetical protein
MGEQITTRMTTLTAIMSSTAFGLGVRDVRADLPPRAALGGPRRIRVYCGRLI